jgi:D-alanyl-lipoteichoic acid acyltransferase DltB (MBOAT superfamily)
MNFTLTFNTVGYFVTFAIVFLINYLIKDKWRWVFLLSCSLAYFAIIDARGLPILIVSILIDYAIALSICRSDNGKKKKNKLILSLVLNISLLIIFKYYNLLTQTSFSIVQMFGWNLSIPRSELIMPLGISFFTFKKISYIIDVYRGQIKAERNLGRLSLYISHFLEIVSGPIDRAGHMLNHVRKPIALDILRFRNGFLLILWGLFQKVVVADRLAAYVDAVFNNVQFHNGPTMIVAAYFYSFQIYCDFAGYTNIAIGCGKMLGYDLMPNFNRPYMASNIGEFWRRWHMTLSYWFRDYLYIPLGGNRCRPIRRYYNLMVVFLLCGLWHGANWTFVVWGGIHGIYLVAGLMTRDIKGMLSSVTKISEKLTNLINVIITFHLVTFSWIFFRANSLRDAFIFIERSFHGWPNIFVDPPTMIYGLYGIVIVFLVELFQHFKEKWIVAFNTASVWIRWPCYYFLLFSIILLGVSRENAFIYFQF